MLQIKSKISVTLLVIILIISTLAIPVNAASGYASKDMQNSYSYTQYNCSFWSQSHFWDVSFGADGTSATKWLGVSPFNADSITHKDILYCSGAGSLSIGASPSGPNASVSISGTTATYTYSVSNEWQININYNYQHRIFMLFSGGMNTFATVQLGTAFYSWGT